MDRARLHIREVEAAGIDADLLRFIYSARTFPVTDPNTLASLIPDYFPHQSLKMRSETTLAACLLLVASAYKWRRGP
jgi:hypothetical protein